MSSIDLSGLVGGPGALADTGGPPGPDVLVGGPAGSGLEDSGGPGGPDALVGGPAPDTGAFSSDHTGGALGLIRTAITRSVAEQPRQAAVGCAIRPGSGIRARV